MTGLWLRMDPAALVRALETPQDCDEVMKAAALKKDLLLGEASVANPYGGTPLASLRDRQHYGEYGAASAAEVAQDMEPHPDGEPTARELAAGYSLPCRVPHGPDFRCFDCATDDELAAATPPAPAGHLPQHTHGEPGCTFPGCQDHDQPATAAAHKEH